MLCVALQGLAEKRQHMTLICNVLSTRYAHQQKYVPGKRNAYTSCCGVAYPLQ